MYKLAKLEKQVPAIGAKLIYLQDTVARDSQIRNQMFEGLSISDEQAGNVDGTIADLTGTLEFHEAQLNIVLGKLNNLQTRMNTVMIRTEKMDKEFSQLDSKLESNKKKSQANELLTKRNRELILKMDDA